MPSTAVKRSQVETVSLCKYPGTVLHNKLTFEANTDRICNKVNQRLFYLRKIRTFHIASSLMKMFYSSLVEAILTFAVLVQQSQPR